MGQHDEYTLLMSLVLDDEATDDEAKTLAEHVAGCTTCARTWQRWQEIDRRFTVAPMAPAPVDFSIAIAAQLDRRLEETRRRRWFMFGLALTWLVAVLASGLAFGLANGWHLQFLSAGGSVAALWAGVTSIGEWVFRGVAGVVERAGTPTVAAGAGALLVVTCGLATVWLWMVARLTPWSDRQMVQAE